MGRLVDPPLSDCLPYAGISEHREQRKKKEYSERSYCGVRAIDLGMSEINCLLNVASTSLEDGGESAAMKKEIGDSASEELEEFRRPVVLRPNER